MLGGGHRCACDHACLRHVGGTVALVHQQVGIVTCADLVAVESVVPANVADELAGVGVEQQLVGVEAVPGFGRPRPMDAPAVDLSATDAGQVTVPDAIGALAQVDALGFGDAEAIEQAAEVGLDLVEVSPNADPPVCKFLDVGKYKYEAQKKANLARKSQKTQEIKEIKMRPNIDDHDFDTKMKKVFDFLEEGDKVKMTMRFRGREMSHTQLGLNVLQRVAEMTAEIAKVEAHPRTEGRQMVMVIAPK